MWWRRDVEGGVKKNIPVKVCWRWCSSRRRKCCRFKRPRPEETAAMTGPSGRPLTSSVHVALFIPTATSRAFSEWPCYCADVHWHVNMPPSCRVDALELRPLLCVCMCVYVHVCFFPSKEWDSLVLLLLLAYRRHAHSKHFLSPYLAMLVSAQWE